jgi:hypothetical protein
VYGGYSSPKLTFNEHVKMWQGANKISILSSAVGLPVSLIDRATPIHDLKIISLHNVADIFWFCRTKETISSCGTSVSSVP